MSDVQREDGRCICGHEPRDHRRLDVADVGKADWFDPDAPPQEIKVMRSYCGVITRRDPWGGTRCKCVLYTPTALLAEQFATVGIGRQLQPPGGES